MITVTRKFTFDAGHRILNHESKCAHLHGHTYVAEVTVREVTGSLDKLGRVIDFSVIKEQVGGWIDQYLDHNMILHHNDDWRSIEKISGKKPWLMQGNPTAENIAKELCEVTNTLLLKQGIECIHVRIWETPNCFADYHHYDHPEVKTLKPT